MGTFQNIILGEWETAVSPNRCLPEKSSFNPYFFLKMEKAQKACLIMDTIYSAYLANIDNFSMLPNVIKQWDFLLLKMALRETPKCQCNTEVTWHSNLVIKLDLENS